MSPGASIVALAAHTGCTCLLPAIPRDAGSALLLSAEVTTGLVNRNAAVTDCLIRDSGHRCGPETKLPKPAARQEVLWKDANIDIDNAENLCKCHPLARPLILCDMFPGHPADVIER